MSDHVNTSVLTSDTVPSISDAAQMAVAAQDRSESPSRWYVRPAFLVAAWTLLVYLCTFLLVRDYYQSHLPHYDSIGSYSLLYELVNRVQESGFRVGLIRASQNSMSWLQPAYALLLALVPARSPEWFVSLNFVLLALGQLSILAYCRTFGLSMCRQLAATVLPVVPGALYTWDGGFQDLRRDPQLTLLLVAGFFASMAYGVAPSWKRGIAVGLLFALAQWSRDNAAAMMSIIALPAIVVIFQRARAMRSWSEPFRLAILPLATFVAVAGPYYWATLDATIQRYTTSVWGVGEDRLESLLAFWHIPAGILLGTDERLGVDAAVGKATVVLLAGVALAVIVLARLGRVRFEPAHLRDRPYALLLAGGAWIIVAVVLFNTLVLGYGARWYAIPFQSVVVGLVGVLCGLLGMVRREPGLSERAALTIVAVGCVVVAASVPLRILLNTTPSGPDNPVVAVRAASIEIAKITAGRPVAFLWSQRFGRHHVRYYLMQAGLPPIVEFEGRARVNGDPIDLDQPLRKGDKTNDLRRLLDRAVRRNAAFVLVTTETNFYQNRTAELWPYQVGRPIVEGWLADPEFVPVANFFLVGRPFVLLENRSLPR